MNQRCMGCMSEIPSGMNFCPVCGYKQGHNTGDGMYIPEGSMVGQYLIGRVLGHGGFGITYIGWDTARQQVVAIKEFFPAGMVGRAGNHTVSVYPQKRDAFNQGLERFQREAEMIRGFADFPGIVEYRDYFQMQGTGYFVMEYVEGVTMKDYVAQRGGRIPFKDARAILMPIMDALEEMHRNRIIHRDISPENIYITKDKRVKLLDFGAARYDNVNEDRSLSIILKHGYAPKEQYFTQGRQGPWTDVYAVAATAYHMMSGRVPQSSIERLENDRLATLSQLGVAIPAPGEQVVMQALALSEDQRFPQMKAFQAAMLSVTVDEAAAMPSYQTQPVQPMSSVQPPVPVQPYPTPVQSVQPAQQQAFSVQPYATPSVQPNVVPIPPARPKKLKVQKVRGKKRIPGWVVGMLILLLFSLGTTGLLVIYPKEWIYQKGIALMEDGRYSQAIHQLERLPYDYRDVDQYILYAKGMERMNQFNYERAQFLLSEVDPDFLDAQAQENYARAGRYLIAGNSSKVIQMMDTSETDDTHNLKKEALYQQAIKMLHQERYALAETALDQLHDIGGYKSSTQYAACHDLAIRNVAFRTALELYHKQKYPSAVLNFSRLGIHDAADPYAYLLYIHYLQRDIEYESITMNEWFDVKIKSVDGRALASKLMEYPDFEDTSSLLMSDILIKYFLEGKWVSQSDHFIQVESMDISPNSTDHMIEYYFSVNQNMVDVEGVDLRFRDGILSYQSSKGAWNPYLYIEYITQDTIRITVLDNDQIIILTRQ